ncbi:hypothetical protein DL768_009643 [Monosporascus sp. mg162]|nr:hypothetical protein DL768_009643 [Monosporascus sp. mg162]
MALPTAAGEKVNDPWALAVAQLHDEDRRNIDFGRPDKLNALADLHALTEKSKQECIKKRWKYTRKSGETVILRDVFDKIVRWIDIFKQVGDVAVQYDPVHAALPWAGIRFVLQIAVDDYNKFAAVIEGVSWMAELICHHTIVEKLYSRSPSEAIEAIEELERALVKLYAAILTYLSKAKYYLEKGSATERILHSGLLPETELGAYLNDIRTARDHVRECRDLADRHDQIHKNTELKRLLADTDAPLRRMDDNLKSIQDDLEKHHEQTKVGVIPRTGQWLLADPIFEQWKKESASSILWLHGIPGSGKSKLVSIVIEDAFNSFDAGRNPPPAFFYCSRNPAEPGRSDPKEILASLARQLSSLEPGKPLLKPTVDLYKKKEAEGFASGSLRIEESCALIMNLAEHYPLTTIMIDALDECDPRKRLDLLKALEKILRESSGLVKIFVSSRDDQDIVFRLQRYPNLEIKSDRNSDDIAVFVKNEAGRLIGDGVLLQYSESQTEMKKLIVKKVIKGASGMFRWASMQLQYLCSFDMDADIRKSLGQLPPDLDTLYAEIYDILSSKPGESQRVVFRSVLSWLLCAQRTLNSAEFLAAVSILPQTSGGEVFVSRALILKCCNNFVVFDAQLDMFRFAHLSVREFLEKRQEYTRTATNALAAEACLWNLVSTNPDPITKRFLSAHGRVLTENSSKTHRFGKYALAYWAVHIPNEMQITEKVVKTAAGNESSGKEVMALLLKQPGDEVKITEEVVKAAAGNESSGKEVMTLLLKQRGDEVKITEGVVKAAAGNETSGKEVMALLLDQHSDAIIITPQLVQEIARVFDALFMEKLLSYCGDRVKITEEVVKAAAGNENSGKEVMALLFKQRGDEVKITEEVVKAAAGNESNGKGVMELFLDQRGDEVKITEEVVKAAAGNRSCGKEVMTLLLDQRGDEVRITRKVVKAAVGHWYSEGTLMLLLDRRRDDGIISALPRFERLTNTLSRWKGAQWHYIKG